MGLLDRISKDRITSLVNLFGHKQRRVWFSNGRAHIEVHTLDPVDMDVFAAALKEQLLGCPAVIWVEVNGVLGRVIVCYDKQASSLESLIEVIESVERRFSLDKGDFGAENFEHPGDLEPLTRHVVRMGADVFGVGLALTLNVLRREPSDQEFDLAAMMTVADNVPYFRKYISKHFGEAATDTGLGLANAITQAIGSGPIGPLVDIPVQIVRLREAQARRRLWEEREDELCHRPELASSAAEAAYFRPTPLPQGAIERYAEDAWQVSLGGFAVGLADTQNFKRALTPILDALPKPTRYGRTGFCSTLGKVLASRGILCINPDVLRLLDRVDSVVVDANLLYTDDLALDRAVVFGDYTKAEVYERAFLLFDPDNFNRIAEQDEWRFGPIDGLGVALSPRVHKHVEQLTNGQINRGPVMGLVHDGKLIALFKTRFLVSPACSEFVSVVRGAGFKLLVASEDEARVPGFDDEEVVGTGKSLVSRIRQEQRKDRVVLMIGDGPSRALTAADCSLGFLIRAQAPPWNADMIGTGSLDDATFVIEACVAARKVSEQSVILAGAGAGIGAMSAIGGLEKTPPQRVMLAVNGASLLALFNGIRLAAELDRRVRPSHQIQPPWHAMPAARVLEVLESAPGGLSEEAVNKRQPPPASSRSVPLAVAQSVLRELANPLTPVLAVGATVSAVVGSVTDAGIVGAVIGVNALIGGVERFKAEQVISRLARRETVLVTAIRDGREVEVDSQTLVPGDVIRLESGDVVPADCRILEVETLEVDESHLTGESLPVKKSPELTLASAVAERNSMLYAGTAIGMGEVTAVVVATGAESEMYRAVRQVRRDPLERSGVEARLEGLMKLILPFATTSGGIMLGVGVLRRQDLQELIGPAVNLAVAAVPEGLPLLATIAQLAAARRLSERDVLVRNPQAMEALGRVDIVCADKTGTLTKGRIRVHSVYDGESAEPLSFLPVSHRCVLGAAMRATPEVPEEGFLPHATDRAFVKGAQRANVEPTEGCESWLRIDELPFKPARGYHAALGRTNDGPIITVKGAPEEVLPRCSTRQRGERTRRLNSRGRKSLMEQVEALAAQGLRILAVAERAAPDFNGQVFDEDHVDKLNFLGFVALSDPVRETSAEAVEKLHQAGVEVMMITGDHSSTAARIAADVGLAAGRAILTGPEIEMMDNDSLDEAITDVKVIARATPNHKVRIVESLQRKGRIVAMTGDGGNDAPAIRLADVGIALGKRSTSAARDAADLVVTDERIETIVDAIVEGRAMWTSVRDAVSILIGGNIGEVGFMLGSSLISRVPGLNARQLLLVNLFTDVAPALAIAMRPPPDVSPETLLHEGPEESLGEALNRDIMWRAAMTGSAGIGAWIVSRNFLMKRAAPTISLLSVVGAQLGQTLVAGRPSAPVWAASLGSAAILLGIIQTPGVSQLFGCRPLGPRGLLTAAGATCLATAASVVAPRALAALDHYRARRAGDLPISLDIEEPLFYEPEAFVLPYFMRGDAQWSA